MNKQELFSKLKENNAFWSYETPQAISDENLIQYVILNLWENEISSLFALYDHEFLKAVWLERCVKQEPFYHSKNLIVAGFFQIKNPEQYLKSQADRLRNF